MRIHERPVLFVFLPFAPVVRAQYYTTTTVEKARMRSRSYLFDQTYNVAFTDTAERFQKRQ